MRSRARWAVVALVATAGLVGPPVPAGAGGSDLAVSSPAAPVPIQPGQPASTTIMVTDVGQDSISVAVTPQRVLLGDNGVTHFAAQPDPLFTGRVRITPDRFDLAPHTHRPVAIDVDVPAGITPDTYVLGFLVSPVVQSGSVEALNQIGAIVALDVPGPRDRRLIAVFHLPRFRLSGSVHGALRASNIGTSALRFSTEASVSGVLVPDSHSLRVKPLLLPTGRFRDVPIAWDAPFGIGWYHAHARVVYNTTDQQTTEVDLSRTVVLVHPLYLLAVVVLIAALLLRRWRRSRRARQPGPLHSARRPRKVLVGTSALQVLGMTANHTDSAPAPDDGCPSCGAQFPLGLGLAKVGDTTFVCVRCRFVFERRR